jgi:hypothetical protein
LVLNDGYCINIKQQDPATGAKTNKNVSSKNYNAYRIQLCQQFMVDMYVKIESERLRYLQFNQKKLRAEDSQNNC